MTSVARHSVSGKGVEDAVPIDAPDAVRGVVQYDDIAIDLPNHTERPPRGRLLAGTPTL